MTEKKSETIAEKARTQAADMAQQAKTSVRTKAQEKAETLRDTAAEKVQETANAAEAAAGEFDAGSIQAQATERLAGTLENMAQQVRSTDLERVARSLGDFARRNPTVFIGGAALLGFAATRFLKARDPHMTHGYSVGDDPWAQRLPVSDNHSTRGDI